MGYCADFVFESQSVYRESRCLLKQYSNTPDSFPSFLSFCIGAGSNPVIGVSSNLFLKSTYVCVVYHKYIRTFIDKRKK